MKINDINEGYGRYYCSTDKKWKTRKGPKQTRKVNEFAPDGFNGGDDDEGFSPEIAKMAQDDGFTKGVSLVDGATLERAMAINYWHKQHGGMYKQYFAKGFNEGRMDKINHDNRQYNLNLQLNKDGSISHGEQGVDEGYGEDDGIHIGASVYHKEHQSSEPFKVVKIIDDQRVGVVDDYGNKKVLFINQLVPAQGVEEAYDHNAPFNAADFNRHMDQLRAREELRKTDPMKALVGDLIDKDREKEALAKRKKPEDDSMSTSDPRHPQYSYTQAGQTNVGEGASDTIYPNAQVIKSKNGKPVGEIYQDDSGWGCFHYKADNGADSIETREEALEWLKDIAEEYRQDRSLREGDDERKQNALWAQITAHEKAAAKSKDLKKQHHLKMADQLRSQLKTSDNELKEFAIDKEPNGDGRSKLIGSIAQLLKAKKKVDFYVPGIRGHVASVGGQGDSLILKRWNKPYSRISYSLGLDSSDDSRFALKMVKPDYYQVVEKGNLEESWRDKIMAAAVAAGAAVAPSTSHGIAGAFPTPSHQAAMYKAAADSNAAQARADAAAKAKADAERLKTNTDQVDKEQKVNHHKLSEFAPGNGDDNMPTAEYEVYQCQLDDQFDWIGGPLLQTDRMDKAHGYAYELWKKHPDKCFMIWQERSQGSRGGYGPVGSVLAPSEEVDEGKDPCWDNYKQIGMKEKNGKKVPNCVPESLEETYNGDEFFEAYGELWFNEDEQLDEAEYHGRSVPLGKPMQGDVKKFKVYVKDPGTGNVKKVNFGDPDMKIRKSNPAARRSFRARHNCDNPGPRTSARYWSCRKW